MPQDEEVFSEVDIPQVWRATRVGVLVRLLCTSAPVAVKHESALLLIGLCAHSLADLKIPEGFAVVINSIDAKLRLADFEVSYAIGILGARAIALIGCLECEEAPAAEARRLQSIYPKVVVAALRRRRGADRLWIIRETA